eukprot:CAMPEP_0184351834 /NCGR_PEP_ID=MMETSP1089-20130417/54952_1 /TAXON_ID=38269 ORGANISM="Gloeochaete wittrockiana, Strain SAG46.84" /NCGR_SAMPLE_ID=MMETSP1089 /ASSEMBLY_ACC=CAM_ASM_000445 /LENGTH=367 /DNA_ID=CAMNT_0026685635 /DNA_START=101 /DNA_END=1204 /DNA_ORIENTATION=-
MEDHEKAIVIDNGSGVVKAGIAGEEVPSVVFPSIIGEPFVRNPKDPAKYVGDEVAPLMGYVKVRYPLSHGKIDRWDDMEAIWENTFKQLGKWPEAGRPVLLTEPPLNPLANREKMTEIMFETYKAPGLYIAIQAVLALYASGRTTGMVLDSGDGVTHTVPVYEGFSVQHAIRRLDIAGRDLTEYMQRLLMQRGYSFTTSAEFQLVREIKEKLCFVLPSRDHQPPKKTLKAKYELPSGEDIFLEEERYQCPEPLFNPELIGKEAFGIHDMAYATVMRCDIDLRRDLFANVVLSGGTTIFSGLADRMTNELESLVPPATKVKVTAPPERKFSVWMGGSILADLMSFQRMIITKDEYYETGSQIVHRKCF